MPKNTKVKISSVVKNQLPDFIRADFPLAGEFLAQYYTALEGQGSTLDVIENIDKYIKVDELTNLIESTNLSTNVGIADNTISVKSTTGFPESYGLLEIDSEIITYTGITTNSFTGCSRGFSGITSYRSPNKTDELVFSNSGISTHSSGTVVNNLSIRFLQEFYKKVKKQITPGFEERTLSDNIDKRLFLKQSKDFYSSKGTDKSFEILFRALYGEDVNVLKPRDFLFIPSESNYKVSEQIVVEPIDGNPEDLINRNLFQDSDGIFPKATGAVNDVEKIVRGEKEYFRISLDYAPSLSRVTGNFSIHPNTKLVDSISIGSTVMSVDSTVGFGTTGTLLANFIDGTSSTINYTSKSLNQFYGCSGVDRTIEPTQDLLSSSYAYGYSGIGTANVVKVRVTGVLSKLDYAFQGNYNSEIGDLIKPKGLGSNVTNIVNKSLFNNISITYDVESIELIDKSNFTYKLTLFDNHIFVIGDSALINDVQCSIISLISSKEVLIKGAGELSSKVTYKIKRLLSKSNLSNYPSANIFTTNIQNSYSDRRKNTYIASPSIPNYFNDALDIRETNIKFSGSFTNSTELTIPEHGLITGEKVTYVGGEGDNKLDITQDEYFVKKIDINTIKLTKSSANIDNDIFVSFSGSVTDNKFEISKFYQKNIKSQKLLRKIHSSMPSKFSNPTRSGKTGILINGVEIVNYKSEDVVNYGPIEEISVVSEGKFYDIVNPPIISITDEVGTGCSAFCEVKGSITGIDVEDGGFDYLTIPTIKISGGNGKGCIATPNLVAQDHNIEFNSIETAGLVNLTTNTIGFSTFHKFRDGELVSYNTEGQTAIAGLTTNASYYCCVKNATTVSLHKNYKDAIAGVSTISLTAYGAGIQELKCQSKKRIISSVSVGNFGSGYTNRLTSINSSGINTATNKISIKNHGYSNGEIIRYDTKGTVISGLATLTDYYVSKVDGDSFRLSAVGVGSTPANFYLRNKKYVNLTDGGSGFHEFNYPPIKVTVDGSIGVSTFSGQDFNAKLRPVGKGSIKSVYVVDGGSGYGSEDIINYNKQPTFELKSGKDAQLLPIVSVEGKITEVIVLNSGTEYNSAPILSAFGEGNGCVLLPILKSGSIDSVKVVHSGIGYTSSNTNVFITPNGRECDLYSNPKTWVINTFEKLLQNNQITSDDGIVTNGLNSDYQLQYSHLYSPRKLRQSTYSKKTVGDKEVFVPDLLLENDIEQTSGTHSPIIGWAYDGSPIYGPYGYSTNSGGSIKVLESGYSVSISSYRPNPLTSDGQKIYPDGFFVEDYVHSTDKDLDEHNGRFCKTPEYPNGVYAYFSTINPTVRDSEGSFKNYRRPQFPYFIGNSYKYEPIGYNFEGLSNQDNVDLNNTNLVRNTDSYNFLFNKTKYDFLIDPSDINEQKTFVTEISAGSISNIGVSTGGYDYRIGDYVVFDNEGSSGYGAHATVKSIQGKTINQINVANTLFENVEFIPDQNTSRFVGYTTSPHNLYQNEYLVISGLNTNGLNNDYIQPVGIKTEQFKLLGDVAGVSTTGIVTFFNIMGNLDPSFIKENDVLGIGTEKIKVLNVDEDSSRIRIIRQYDSTIGSSHTSYSLLSQKPRRLYFSPPNPNDKSDYGLNRELYFNPKESVSLGNVSGVGIGSTLFFSNPGVGISQIFIPTKSIYFKDHGLKSGDTLTYRTNEGTALGVSTDGTMEFTLSNEQTLYAAPLSKDLIGIATARVGVGSTGSFVGINSTTNISTLFFTGIGTGLYHSFKTNYSNVLSGQLKRSLVTVSTSSTHGLKAVDTISLAVNPGITTTIKVAYNDYNRRLVINPRSYSESDVDTSNNTITISKHGYVNGQKIVSTATTSPGGLVDDGIYYVYVVDEDKIKLCNEFYESINLTPHVIDITSSYAGVISPINPRIALERDQQVDFDLSDSSLSFVNNEVSYSAFDFNLYSDVDLNNLFFTSGTTDDFNISRTGRIGIDANAVLTIKNIKQIKKGLYYNLSPINDDLNTDVKKEIIRDIDNNLNSNSLVFTTNPLTGSHQIVGVGSTTFLFSAPKSPKKLDYSLVDGNFAYSSYSTKAKGPISSVNLRSKGKQYRVIPGISTIRSYEGKDAILKPQSSTIGRISNVEIQNIGFDYSADNTLRPQAQIPHLMKIDALASIKSIGISSVGTNYLNSPGLIVLDGLTNKEVSEIDLDYELGDTNVTILKNSKSLNDIIPKIIPISNSNGITINNIDYNSGTGDVTVTIGASFSDAADYPFEVGKKVMIEGVSVGLGSTGKGYNSENYNYKLFEILATDPNIGGTLGTVRYSLSNSLTTNEVPGEFKSASSFGKIVPEEYFPIFDVKIEQNRFEVGETLVSGNKTAVLQSWNKLNDYIKVSSSFDFEVGETLFGESSKTKAVISEYTSYNTLYDIGSSSIVREGWKTNSGFLNNNQQRIFDSNYYQYFSYSLQSEVEYTKWDEPVSTLNHTSGFKKFSDLIVRSETDVGVSTIQDQTSFDVITDLISVMDLNTVFDFDLVTEKTLDIDSSLISDEIVFDTRILQDYTESIGNRVLTVDDISTEFNNNARTDAFMSVDSFTLASVRYRKYLTFIRDKRYTKERQILLVSALHDDTGNIFLNQYGRVETNTDLGEFGGDLGSYDMDIAGDDGRLLFFPKKFKYNNYDVSNVAFNISDSVAGVGSTGLGGIVNITSSTTTIPLGITTQHSIVSFATTYRGSKVLVSYAASDASYWEHDEITLVHDGTNVDMIEYGQLTTSNVGSASGEPGLGTYSAYIAGSRVHLDLHPTVSTASTYVANTIHVDFGNASSAGVGTTSLNTCNLDSRYTAISASGSPSATAVAQYETETFNGAYYVVCVEDTTNSHYQISEVIVVDDGTTPYVTEYAINQTVTNLGDFSAAISGDYTSLTFTPIASANVQVRVFQAALRLVDEANDVNEIDLTNATIDTGFGAYTATETDVKRAFDLKHRQLPIFKRDFVGSASTTVNLSEDSIRLPDHYFVTGEELTYRYTGAGTTSAIEIESQSITGYGTTDKMPSKVFAVKVDDSTIRLATSAENALKTTPTYLDITAVGVGTSHSFTSTKQNSRCILSIDNVVQSPIVSTAVTTTITADVSATTDKIKISGITSITGGDMLKIGDEIMKVDSVGLGATNVLLVTRPWMGTQSGVHTSGTTITKVDGAYNIVDSTVNFFTAPVGLTPLSTTTNEPDERDFVGIATHSTFNGRSFMRSGISGSSDEPYAGNYIFDDISSNFTGLTTEFTLKSGGSNIAGFSTNNALILVNQIPQGPQRYTGSVAVPGDYTLIEGATGITSVQFTGSISSITSDPNSSNVPLGGVIVSVGSTEGLGYQPLVAAGGTAVVSGLGTISSVSIGNSGSGYRTGIQTIVNVGVQTLSTGAPNIEFIGTAAISGGNIVSIAITNPGTGYTSTNPPLVVIDEPLSYSNMPLFYPSNQSGVGSEARANVVVGLGGSVIDFEITNQGYGYGETQKLTIGVGGAVGIPTAGATEFREFQLTVNETISDSFAGWTVGDFQVLDPLDSLFDGKTISFALNLDGVQQSIQSKPGSNINVEVALLVFINDILQVPSEGYEFKGGSYITFKEAPKSGDTSKILFYRGTGSVDVSNVDILETIKKGDTIKLYDKDINLEENKRVVSNINSADSVNTNLYAGPGITTNESFRRAVTWSKQTEDKFIDGEVVSKDRPHYEPLIYPNTNIIQSVGVGSTVIFVSNIRTFFDSTKENYTGQNNIRIISQDNIVGASATAFVSAAGTVTSFDITNPGFGYTIAPTVSITTPVGYTTSQGARATATISGVGTVNAITVSYGGTATGFAYTNTAAPSVLIGEPKLATATETIENVSYSGDFGIISGISTTSVGVASTGIVFDLLLPKESLFRDASIVGSALTVSGITTGYYFTVTNSNVGASVTSLYQDGTVVGIGTSFLDNVYEVAQVSIAQTMGIGIGLTYVAQVTVSVQDYNGLTGLGYSEFFGEYSWGRIATQPRGKARVFTSYAGNSTGLSGISSSPIVERVNPLRYVNYNT
jgi:hypothetical protein